MAYPVTINGRTYTLADFEGTNYVSGFPDALEDFVTQAGDIYNSTSTTSNTVGTGSKTFTTADSGKPYQAGTPLRIADAAAPATNWMDCIVTSYSGTTLVVDAFGYAGSGTKTSWNINIGGAKTVDGTLAVAQGGTGATTAAGAAANLGIAVTDTTVKTANFTATAGNQYVCNTSGGAFTLTLPSTPSAGDIVGFADYTGTFATENLTVARNGSNIVGLAEDMTVDVDYAAIELLYIDGTEGWIFK